MTGQKQHWGITGMRYNCRCEPTIDYATQRIMAQALHDALFTEVLIFRKDEWIEDCGFTQKEELVEFPRGYDSNEEKVAFYKKCISLLDSGWKNEWVNQRRVRIEELIRKGGGNDRPAP